MTAAEDRLVDALCYPPSLGGGVYGHEGPEAEALVSAFAHELAEKVRAQKGISPGEDAYFLYAGMGFAADLIDPEVADGQQ